MPPSHRLTEVRERLMGADYEPRPSPLAWKWMRLRASDTSKRAHLVRLESGWWVAVCGLRLTTRAEQLVNDTEWKCQHCAKRSKGRV